MVVVNNTTAGKIIPTIVKNLYRIHQAFRTEAIDFCIHLALPLQCQKDPKDKRTSF